MKCECEAVWSSSSRGWKENLQAVVRGALTRRLSSYSDAVLRSGRLKISRGFSEQVKPLVDWALNGEFRALIDVRPMTRKEVARHCYFWFTRISSLRTLPMYPRKRMEDKRPAPYVQYAPVNTSSDTFGDLELDETRPPGTTPAKVDVRRYFRVKTVKVILPAAFLTAATVVAVLMIIPNLKVSFILMSLIIKIFSLRLFQA